MWQSIKDKQGVDALKQHLLDCSDSNKYYYGWNHWKTTLCFSLAKNSWFLNTYMT